MSWDSKDHLRQRGRQSVGGLDGFPAMLPPKEGAPDAMPTLAEMIFWDAAMDDGTQDDWVSRDDARELMEMGMVSGKQWDAWAHIARRGITEI